MARVAAALALVLLVQGAFAAPSLCGCGYPYSGLPYSGAYSDASASALALSSAALPAYAPTYPADLSVPAPLFADNAYANAAAAASAESVAFAAPAPLAYSAPLDVVSPLSIAAPVASSPAVVPVGSPQVVATNPGPSTAYTTGPFCKTATYQPFPVQSSTKALSGPVSVSSAVLDGYCSTACAATRAKCAGTTKNVSFKTPTVINKGSRTSSIITPAGNSVTTRSTKAGTPQVSTQVIPGPTVGPIVAPGYPVPLYDGALAAPAYAPAPFYAPASSAVATSSALALADAPVYASAPAYAPSPIYTPAPAYAPTFASADALASATASNVYDAPVSILPYPTKSCSCY